MAFRLTMLNLVVSGYVIMLLSICFVVQSIYGAYRDRKKWEKEREEHRNIDEDT